MSEFESTLDDLQEFAETQETVPSTTERVGSLLTIDIGSVNTKAALFDMVEGRFRFLAAGLILLFGVAQYFVSLVATHAAIACYLAYRIATRDGLALADQDPFAPFPARASALTARLLVRRRSG